MPRSQAREVRGICLPAARPPVCLPPCCLPPCCLRHCISMLGSPWQHMLLMLALHFCCAAAEETKKLLMEEERERQRQAQVGAARCWLPSLLVLQPFADDVSPPSSAVDPSQATSAGSVVGAEPQTNTML